VVGVAQGHLGVLLGHQEADTLVAVEGADYVKDLLDYLRCQAHRGLVEQEKARARNQLWG